MPMTSRIQSLIRERKEQQRILYERERRDDEARRDGRPVVDEHAERLRELSVRLEHLEARKLLDRFAWARNARASACQPWLTRPVRPVQASRQPTAAENWRSAGLCLTGANWHQWNRCNQRLGDGFAAMMLSREDRAFVRACMLDGGQSLLDAERR